MRKLLLPKPNHFSGFFAERIPRELKDEFQRIYPGRKAKRELIIAAMTLAIKHRPKELGSLMQLTISPYKSED